MPRPLSSSEKLSAFDTQTQENATAAGHRASESVNDAGVMERNSAARVEKAAEILYEQMMEDG
ncbi:hypothetical protein MMC13_002241 [Lambiella insularis]|nr:hypothetical protein [Lambiella insularis]